ncbi:MAG: protein kinase, partial [Gemmataceae bacterium]|nr:protein kinase [Gemmataceae bacterium]
GSVRADDPPAPTVVVPGDAGRPLPLAGGSLPANPYQEQAAAAVLKKFQAWSLVEAVLWLGGCLADGLAHAHERGIVHRDLKPANVLITDEGTPMLLDFNLAEDVKLRDSASAAAVGGTLPYMAPEQLDAFSGRPRPVDARADLFALGIILFELLTGRSPWDHDKDSAAKADAQARNASPVALDEVVQNLYRQRQQPAASVRRYNQLASPAVDAILRRCLAPDPQRRYQTARELQEDLQRQLESRPLKHAREPSPRERLHKFLRRNPRLLARLAVAAAVVLLLVAVGLGLRSWRLRQQEQHLQLQQQAKDNHDQFRKELPAVQFDVTFRGEHQQLVQGHERCRKALQRYAVLTDPHWREQPAFALLAPELQQRVQKDVGDLLLLLVLAEQRLHAPAGGPLAPQTFDQVLRWNEEAQRCLSASTPSPVVLFQRAELYDRQGQPAQAGALRAQAGQLPLETAHDCYLHARDLMYPGGQVNKALPLLQKATRLDPQNYWAHFLLGVCHGDLGNHRDAVAAYGVCIALDPSFFGAWYNRGTAYLNQQKYHLAADDFSAVIRLEPRRPDPFYHRALAHQRLGQGLARKDAPAAQAHYQQALDDLARVLALGARAEVPVLLFRARIKKALGDSAGYRQDLAVVLSRSPADDKSWVAQGLAHLELDPQAKPEQVQASARQALAAFDRALQLNPTYRPAWENKVYVYSAFLNRPAEAIDCLGQLIQLYPDLALARANRGVLHARLGQVEPALRDAQASLALDQAPEILYRVGCIYALNSRSRPGDQALALKYLKDALRAGYGFSYLADDTDLDPLRPLPEFQKLVEGSIVLGQ